MDYLEEMEKFLEKYNLPKLNQEETENLNRPIKIMGEKNYNKKKKIFWQKICWNPGPDDFTGEFHQKFREELTPILLRFFQKLQREVNSQTDFMRPPSP